MKVLVLGGGVSSSLFAYHLKKELPSIDVSIIEASDKLLKRVLVSGNGRANFFNEAFLLDKCESNFTSQDGFKRFIKKEDANKFLDILSNDFCFHFIKDEEGRYYPFSNQAISLHKALINGLNKTNVNVLLDEEVLDIDPSKKIVKTSKSNHSYDYLFIGLGGKSYDRDIKSSPLNKLNIKLNKYDSALCPLKTKEKIPHYLEGTRLKALISYEINNKKVYEESGEVLFKKDGLSGIAIFNSSLFFKASESNKIIINPFIRKEGSIIKSNYNLDELNGILPEKVVQFIAGSKYNYSYQELLDKLTFSIKEKYDLKQSQISLGGISLDSINDDLSLINHSDIYVGGEIIDLHAICGGFNMGFSFLSGLNASDNLIKRLSRKD